MMNVEKKNSDDIFNNLVLLFLAYITTRDRYLLSINNMQFSSLQKKELSIATQKRRHQLSGCSFQSKKQLKIIHLLLNHKIVWQSRFLLLSPRRKCLKFFKTKKIALVDINNHRNFKVTRKKCHHVCFHGIVLFLSPASSSSSSSPWRTTCLNSCARFADSTMHLHPKVFSKLVVVANTFDRDVLKSTSKRKWKIESRNEHDGWTSGQS